MDAAVSAQQLGYEEQLAVFVLQGLANREGQPRVYVKAGFLDFDWPDAEPWWRSQLEDRVAFVDVPATLCDLVDTAISSGAVNVTGCVLYENALGYDSGYTAPMAVTLSSLEGLLPLTSDLRARHPCLATLDIVHDLRIASAPHMASRSQAWRWAIDTLLPRASRSTIMNLYRYDPHWQTDPQSHATLASLDYAVHSQAFILDLQPDDPADAAMLAEVLLKLDPLFDAFGWAHDEHAWTKAVSLAGGSVFCSFASPNLSFWALLALSPAAGGRARRLPSGDSGRALDRSKYYVTFETNEGDTPRIAVSAFGSSWASPQRGSVPVAWSVDPLLAERFPALMDFFASTARSNDSFIGGVAGGGYVYLGMLSAAQLERYAKRVGRLFETYGPTVADTYGQANFTTMAQYSQHAKQGGVAPVAYVSQPEWAHGSYGEDSFRCPVDNLRSPIDATPVVCSSNDPNLFYFPSSLNTSDPSGDLAQRIRQAATRFEPPFFVLTYGGLTWTAAKTDPKQEFWRLLQDTMQHLGPDFVAVGASEMARLSKAACAEAHEPPGSSCAVMVQQVACSPNTQQACEKLGCCWHDAGIQPSGHRCIQPELVPAASCATPRAAPSAPTSIVL